ncbi:MAG: ethanolamine ammonia-lyase reactivating factor EutA, partial [Chloroflexi bacterium]|nr:ethanolamine ammonia-lyase reactivating factor EutA [Chloroflexota bacterium]
GVIMLDIGGGTMDIVAYNESALYHTSSFPLGGNHIISDISIALNTSQPVAETVLKEYGMAVLDRAKANDEAEIRCFGISGSRRFRMQYLYEVISLRLTEMFVIALEVVKKTGQPAPASTLVLTGGLAGLPGIDKLAERVLRMEARIGAPPQQEYAADTLKNPSFAALIGMLQISSDALFAPAPPPKPQANGGIAAGGLRILQQINQKIDVLRS